MHIQPPPILRANYVITVADDFVVEAYHNGKAIKDENRHMLQELFGATSEKIDQPVHKGDWLVFHVVNNRLRWGGASYFGAAGCFTNNEFGFVTKPGAGGWSVCDNVSKVDRFIRNKMDGTTNYTNSPSYSWPRGDELMRSFAGDRWNGEGIWGKSRSVWIKIVVD